MLLHYNLPNHLGMNSAKVRIGSGFGERKREFVVGVERLRAKQSVGAGDHVGNVIAVHPRDCAVHGNRYLCGAEREVVHADFDGWYLGVLPGSIERNGHSSGQY